MRASAVALLVGLLAPLALAAPTAEMVLTPSGYRPKANVHAIPAGGSLAHVGNEIHVLAADGTVVHVATAGAPQEARAAVARENFGWIGFAIYTGTAPITSLTTKWTVPPVPATDNGQTVFLFNALAPTGGSSAILQPVLQYGRSNAGGGPYWALASWYVDADNTFFTPLVNTTVGATLTGVVTLTGQNGTAYSYNSQFAGVPETSLDVSSARLLSSATETLEAYSITASSDYPTGATVFSEINLEFEAGTAPSSVTWVPGQDTADGIFTTVDTDGATDAQVTVAYPLA
ncbi:hypothetical protein FB451DRAFT_141382 [Mycena latifolia]|nr:hypothetical protein FB451DRAFT_141382 [Mycena latifolia]